VVTLMRLFWSLKQGRRSPAGPMWTGVNDETSLSVHGSLPVQNRTSPQVRTSYDAPIRSATGNESLMWKWVRRLELSAGPGVTGDVPTAERHLGKVSGRAANVPSRYVPLHKYLVNRYADSVVLTFAQLEDLTGCPLPDSARAQQEWWTSSERDADKSSCAVAWILAGRTAKPNLQARTVTFERRIGSFETEGRRCQGS
jgi:hypothetical protein